MTDGGKRRLGDRLRSLREGGLSGEPVTQGMVAGAFSRSVPLISSWEKGKAVPAEHWLHAYARLFAAPRSSIEGRLRLPPLQDLHGEERDRFERLFRELRELRAAGWSAGRRDTAAPATPDPWHFADRSPVTLVCARAATVRAAPESPDYVELAAYADLDALMELHSHVHAANPGVPVHHKLAGELDQSDITNHLVLLGGAAANPLTHRVMQALELPVTQDLDTGAFRVTGGGGRPAVFGPRLEGAAPEQRLLEDVAHFCRAPNPFNRARSVTICNGNHTRGTYAAVRTLTDPRFQDRNVAHLRRRYGPGDAYSILARAVLVAGEVITPDWTRDGTVLHEWPDTP